MRSGRCDLIKDIMNDIMECMVESDIENEGLAVGLKVYSSVGTPVKYLDDLRKMADTLQSSLDIQQVYPYTQSQMEY